MADNIKYRFIQNVGDYFPSGYFSDDFLEKVQKCAGISNDELKKLGAPFVTLQHDYDEYKNFIINQNPRVEDAIKKTHDFNTRLLKILGYDPSHPYEEPCIVNEDTDPVEMIPVRHILREGNQVKLFIMEMQNLISVDDSEPAGLFEQQYESDPDKTTHQQKYYAGQWRYVFQLDKTKYKISPAVINKAITQIFLLPEERRPHFILMLAGNEVFLFDKDKWAKGSYLEFSLDELFAQARIPAFRNYYGLFHMLVSKQTLAAEGDVVLMDNIIEESYKNAYEVTKDLREGVVLAVETLANEVLYYMNNIAHKPFGKYNEKTGTYDETDDAFESEVKDDCLTIVYRLLFLFYAESRDELEILPTHDEVYEKGYSLESLRDLEMVRLNSQESRDGYFFDESMHHLFDLLSKGQPASKKGFSVRPIDSPLFDDTKLKVLQGVRIRNIKWQEIIRALSLSRKKNYCGRISYANLGVNQLGSVYESLLAYRGFYAEQDYIEVHKANDEKDGTFLVPYSRMTDFDIATEVKTDPQTGAPVILPKGTFVYRLNGRDRQKSASYYTPEVLTRSTVKYTLKAILDDVRSGKRKATDLLDLKILEPAMGAAAFQNEVINQLAEAYLQYRQEEKRKEFLQRNDLDDDKIKVGSWRIAPDKYRDELQKVKAYIATHNVYGVDLNPTAIELGKLSLWLNVIHKDMETPFFSNRLALGNAVIGAWLKVYNKKDVIAIQKSKGGRNILLPNAWWEKAPHKVSFSKNNVKRSVNEIYHFLLPDKNMLGVSTIKDYKDKAKAEKANSELEERPTYGALERMKKMIKDWTEPISESDFRRLQKLSDKIDFRLKEYLKFQLSVERLTQNKKQIWGVPGEYESEMFETEKYQTKEDLNDARYRHDNAYFRLKMVMDYWCALWFWNIEDAKDLPTRNEYWNDIEAMLNVSDEKLNSHTAKALKRHIGVDSTGQLNMFPEGTMNDMFYQHQLEEQYGIGVNEPIAAKEPHRQTEDESEIVTMSKEEILTGVQSQPTTFFDKSQRFKIVDRLSKRYHFFHPMLEFLEVFWLRDGFDIICGNPPWVLPAFDVIGIFSDKFPEVVLQGKKAPEVRVNKECYFSKDPELEKQYYSELIESTCDNLFTNSPSMYPFLKGIKTDLYMCILESTYDILSKSGYIGMIHPESIYDTAKLNAFREEAYHRLRYHFQYSNELRLFAEVHHETTYSVNIYGCYKDVIGFKSIHNLFTPNTVDACFIHDGHGFCHGVKYNGNWNTEPHADRIVYFDKEALSVLAEVFGDSDTSTVPKLINTQSESTISVVEKLAKVERHVRDYQKIITVGFNETTAVDDGLIERRISQPTSSDDIILNGPHIYVSTSFYKMPRLKVENNSSYDIIDYTKIDENFVPSTCFRSLQSHADFRNSILGFPVKQDRNGNVEYDCWLDHYKLGISEWVGSSSERTLSGGILAPGMHHIGTIVSVTLRNNADMVELCGLVNSLPLDFLMKITGLSHVKKYLIDTFPIGIDDKYKTAMFSRVLMLNCLTKAYSDLWTEMWNEEYTKENWSIKDTRLRPFSRLEQKWNYSTPLRTYFERHQALLELDVISAMALGLSLRDLETIYSLQFPVFSQYENDTWYDNKGNIVYTKSSGLKGVGLSRKGSNGKLGWEDIRGEKSADSMTYDGNSTPYVHTIDPAKSELYGGQQVTYYPPYTRCDRIADYRRAWAFFEKKFK